MYNSNDGNCTISGEQLDFYADGVFIGTVNAGSNRSVELEEGVHYFRVLLTSTQAVELASYEMTVAGDGWWFKYGCADGTYPQGSKTKTGSSTVRGENGG